MPNASKAACELSIQHLFREDLFNRVEGCYLWTYTFADDVAPTEAARRWRLFVRWHVETDRKCVRVLESGSKNGRWHYHCITSARWDVNEVRAAAERCGFGRINVKPIPQESARYVAKYLNKDSCGELPKGQRRWACVGFKGVPANRVRFSSETIRLPKVWSSEACTVSEWQVGGGEMITKRVRKAEGPEFEEVHRVVMSGVECQSVVRSLEAGEILTVGEYRGLIATKKAACDPVTGTRLEHGTVEHTLSGCGETWTVTEWLSLPVQLKAVRLPVEPGTIVKTVIRSVRRVRGQTYLGGLIKPLIEEGDCRNKSQSDA